MPNKKLIKLHKNDVAMIIREDGTVEFSIPEQELNEDTLFGTKLMTGLSGLILSGNKEFIELIINKWNEVVDEIKKGRTIN